MEQKVMNSKEDRSWSSKIYTRRRRQAGMAAPSRIIAMAITLASCESI